MCGGVGVWLGGVKEVLEVVLLSPWYFHYKIDDDNITKQALFCFFK